MLIFRELKRDHRTLPSHGILGGVMSLGALLFYAGSERQSDTTMERLVVEPTVATA